MFFQIEKVEDVILDCDLDIVINNDGDVDGWCRLPWKFNRWSWWWRRSSQSERLSCGERCRRWLSSGWFDEESDFGVVVVVLGLNSRDYFAKFFIRKNCVLGECLRFNVEFVKRFRIRISSFDPSSSLTVLEIWRCRNARPKQDFEVRLSGRLSRSGAPHITSLASWILLTSVMTCWVGNKVSLVVLSSLS